MKILTLCLLLLLSGCLEGPRTPDNKIPNEVPKEDKGLFYEFEEEALLLLDNMTIEEKIGQMFLARCPEEEHLKFYLSMKPGGFIMFGRDFYSKMREEVINNMIKVSKAINKYDVCTLKT